MTKQTKTKGSRARWQELEAKMKAFMDDKGPVPTDDELRELWSLRKTFKQGNK